MINILKDLNACERNITDIIKLLGQANDRVTRLTLLLTLSELVERVCSVEANIYNYLKESQ